MGCVEAKQTLLSKPGNAAPPPPNPTTGCDKAAVTLIGGGGDRGAYMMVLGNSEHLLCTEI